MKLFPTLNEFLNESNISEKRQTLPGNMETLLKTNGFKFSYEEDEITSFEHRSGEVFFEFNHDSNTFYFAYDATPVLPLEFHKPAEIRSANMTGMFEVDSKKLTDAYVKAAIMTSFTRNLHYHLEDYADFNPYKAGQDKQLDKIAMKAATKLGTNNLVYSIGNADLEEAIEYIESPALKKAMHAAKIIKDGESALAVFIRPNV